MIGLRMMIPGLILLFTGAMVVFCMHDSIAVTSPNGDILTLLIFQMTIVLLTSLACGWIARRLGQARVIGETVSVTEDGASPALSEAGCEARADTVRLLRRCE